MSIELTCTVCSAVNAFLQEQAGLMGKCGHCQTPLYIPRPEELPPASIKRGGSMQSPRSQDMLLVWGAVGTLVLLLLVGGGVGLYFLLPATPANANPIDPFAAATPVALAAAKSVSQDAVIEQANGEALFKFKAPAGGTVAVYLDLDAGSKLDGFMTAYDAQHKELAQSDADSDKRTSQLLIPVANDQEYYVKLAGRESTAGKGKLHFKHVATLSSQFDNAQEVRLSRTGLGHQVWRMERVDDEHVFRLTAPVTGWMIAEIANPLGGNLDGTIAAYDTDKKIVTPPNPDRKLIRFYVEQGKTYYLKAASNAFPFFGMSRLGPYSLNFRTDKTGADDYGNDFSSAHQVAFNNFISFATKKGQIETELDVDMFTFKAPKTGTMNISVLPEAGSQLDAGIWTYGESRQETSLMSDNRNLNLPVQSGQSYYVKVMPFNKPRAGMQKTGQYSLQFSMQSQFSQPPFKIGGFGNAQLVTLNAVGGTTVSGEIFNSATAYYYRFIATKDGLQCIDLNKPSDIFTNLDAEVHIYDANQKEIGLYPTGLNGDFFALAGTTYYAKVSARLSPGIGKQSTGKFMLRFFTISATPKQKTEIGKGIGATGNSGNSVPGKAAAIFLSGFGSGEASGQVTLANVPVYFRFEGTKVGKAEVQLSYPAGSLLDADLYVYDANQKEIGIGNGRPVVYSIPVAPGTTCYVKVISRNPPGAGTLATGAFKLKITTFNDFK